MTPAATSEAFYRDVVAFAHALRRAGMPVGLERTELFAQALATAEVVSRRELYLAARATLLTRRDDLPLFDEQFAAFFGGDIPVGRGQKMPMAPRHDAVPKLRTALTAYMAERVQPKAPEVDVPDEVKAASQLEQLQTKEFSDCTPAELATLAAAMRDIRFQLTLRRSLRLTRAHRGHRLDLPRILRDAGRHGGLALMLHRRRHKLKRRPLVVLADISGSMELYSRILLQFLHVITRRHGHTESFVFGTRLTCITSQLQLRDVNAALGHAARAIVDFAGGTRISDCLHVFNRRYARRVLRKGAVVLFISDGWETGDPALLDQEMRQLHARSHRLVWLNPLLGRAGYEPLARGMQIALAHVDDFLPVNNLQSLQELAWHLGRIPRRKGSVKATRFVRSEVSG